MTGSSMAASNTNWDPRTTWVFAVGILRFQDSTLATYPEKGRVDAKMMTAFAKRGVPADHTVFIQDAQATRAHIVQQLQALLDRTAAGDTLVFYYAGHGFRDYDDAARPVSFLTYESDGALPFQLLLDTLAQRFHGSRALLLADCCYSGALAAEAQRHAGHGSIAFAALTSAQPTSTSTGAWTFTQAIADLLNGDRRLDLDHDGRITLDEAARYINDAMAFQEGQLSSFATTGGFPADWVLAQAQGDAAPPVSRAEGLWEGQWLKVTILRTEGKRSLVHWAGWDDSEDSWLPADQIRPYQPKTWPVGAAVRIKWDDKWYPGKVLRNQLGLQLVHYDGYQSVDDEWVTPDRLKAH